MNIYKAETITTEIVDAFNRLIPQLADSLTPPSKFDLETVLKSASSHLFLVELDGEIVGTVTLLIYAIPSGKKGRIEDVIVDQQARGKGVAMSLMKFVIDYARNEGINKLDLTSNPSRKAAHALYEKCGFKKVETNVFRLLLE